MFVICNIFWKALNRHCCYRNYFSMRGFISYTLFERTIYMKKIYIIIFIYALCDSLFKKKELKTSFYLFISTAFLLVSVLFFILLSASAPYLVSWTWENEDHSRSDGSQNALPDYVQWGKKTGMYVKYGMKRLLNQCLYMSWRHLTTG